MFVFRKPLHPLLAVAVLSLSGCVGLVPGTNQVTVKTAGGGAGSVTSAPSGIDCAGEGAGATSGTCQQTFSGTNTVVLTATPNQGFTFGGWSGCKSVNGMTCTVSGAATVTATFTASLQSINHIIFLAQENRS